MSDSQFHYVLYYYTPSLPAAIIAIVAFALATSAHIWKLYTHRTLYFIPFVIGGLFETVGYAGRAWSHFDTLTLGGFIMQSLLILLAPALFAASIYMILGRLITSLNANRLSVIPVKWLTKLFVLGDVFSFLLQLSGGGLLASATATSQDVGQKLIVAGLFAQVVFFGFFVVTTVIFNIRMRKHTQLGMVTELPWQRHLTVLYVTSLLILVRSVIRIVEYLQGNAGYLITHEVFIYVFDMLLMVSVMAILLVWYVGDIGRRRQDREMKRIGSSHVDDHAAYNSSKI